MGVRKNLKHKDKNLESKQKDIEKVHYLFFYRIFSIEDIEHYFKGKYSYDEIKAMIRDKYKKYYEEETVNGR